jgi:hypothetical protein
MRETAILGVIGSGRIRQCIDCRAAAGAQSAACNGFGPGCFLPMRQIMAEPSRPSPTRSPPTPGR